MTDRELSEALQAIDASDDVTLDDWECDFIDSFQRVRKEKGTSRDWWTPGRREAAAQIIDLYGDKP